MQAGSLIISVFGDALFPRGGGIWVGSLAKLLEPLALNERLVRTALFRLVKEDWLQPQVRGRRSDYFLSPTGQHRIAEASRHIYANTDPVWDQRWRLILIAGELQPKEREALRSALFWHGFGSLSPAVFIHPSAELGTAFDALLDEGLGSLRKSLLPMLAGELGFAGAASSADVVKRAWDLDQLGLRYASFVQTYQPLLEVARLHGAQAATDADQDGIDDQSAFLLRVLLIHDYRRLLLRLRQQPLGFSFCGRRLHQHAGLDAMRRGLGLPVGDRHVPVNLRQGRREPAVVATGQQPAVKVCVDHAALSGTCASAGNKPACRSACQKAGAIGCCIMLTASCHSRS